MPQSRTPLSQTDLKHGNWELMATKESNEGELKWRKKRKGGKDKREQGIYEQSATDRVPEPEQLRGGSKGSPRIPHVDKDAGRQEPGR